MTAIGIDLGTTNSVVARQEPDKAGATTVVTIAGQRSTPSVVGGRMREGKEELLVGAPALNWAKRDPANTILSVKRLMGRDFADPAVTESRDRRSYRITAGPDEDPRAHVVILGTTHSPADVSTMILKRLRQGAEEKLKQEITHAVITVPAYFRQAQRAATREAGERAGLVVKRIIDEPTAAAIAFGVELDQGERRRILVYDLGGGTFDISILNAIRDGEGMNHFQVLEFNGDNWLGGDDFDQRITERIIDWVKENAGVDPSGDAEFLFQAKQAAEEAKKQLSEADWTEIIIPAAFRSAGGVVDVELTVTRAEFDKMIGPMIGKTLTLVRAALTQQGLNPDDISDVLLVGGSTLVPRVRDAVEEFFGGAKVRRHVDPMECVAIGAGILAGTLSGVECPAPGCATVNDEAQEQCTECQASLVNARSAGETHIYDVTGMALGVGAVRGSQRDVFVPIIPRGTPYPMSQPMQHNFEATDERLIRIPVFEGDDPVASQNQEQGVLEYELPDDLGGDRRVSVRFLFDRNRVLQVKVLAGGVEYNAELSFDTGGARAAVDGPEDEDDVSYREDLVQAEDFTRRFLRNYGQYIDPAQALRIQEHLDQAQDTLVYSDPAECRRMKNVLISDVFGAGLATQLLLAERAAERANAGDAARLNEAIAAVEQSFQAGSRDVPQQAAALRVMVAKVDRAYEVAEVGDAEDYEGLLRMMEES